MGNRGLSGKDEHGHDPGRETEARHIRLDRRDALLGIQRPYGRVGAVLLGLPWRVIRSVRRPIRSGRNRDRRDDRNRDVVRVVVLWRDDPWPDDVFYAWQEGYHHARVFGLEARSFNCAVGSE